MQTGKVAVALRLPLFQLIADLLVGDHFAGVVDRLRDRSIFSNSGISSG
jgi:hypothetical protein